MYHACDADNHGVFQTLNLINLFVPLLTT